MNWKEFVKDNIQVRRKSSYSKTNNHYKKPTPTILLRTHRQLYDAELI